jgi:hypothetical protein
MEDYECVDGDVFYALRGRAIWRVAIGFGFLSFE